jgi:hypothetical protein
MVSAAFSSQAGKRMARAVQAPTRHRKTHLLRLAVSNTVRAQILEAAITDNPSDPRRNLRSTREAPVEQLLSTVGTHQGDQSGKLKG